MSAVRRVRRIAICTLLAGLVACGSQSTTGERVAVPGGDGARDDETTTAASGDGTRAGTSAASEPATSEAPSDPELRTMLEAHNRVRAQHCAPPLAWSGELASMAQAWADDLASRGCAFEHSSSPFGENLAAGTPSAMTAGDVVALWHGEVERYDFRRGRFGMDTGHFTQLVWVGSQRLGCGSATCRQMRIWVCNYDPAGNVQTQFRENVLPTSCR